jgi:Ca2+/Na+ antiporter
VTDLGTSQRSGGAPDGAVPGEGTATSAGPRAGADPQADAGTGRQWSFRLWPPEISGNTGTFDDWARTVAASFKPAALWRNHRLFVIAVCVSVIPRVIAALGFKPALLIQDSFSYMKQSVQLLPLAELRPAGYPLMLHALQPFHSLLLVTTVQHVMGIGLGTIIYVVLRTRGLPAWGAVLAAAPTLFDSRQIWLESSILPDTLFTLTLMIAVAILIVRPRPAIWQAAIVGLLVSYASVIRGNGAPVFVVILIFMLIMRVGWKAFAACVAAFVVPLAVYVMIFFSDHNQLNITDSTGLFLWSRTMSFANCSIIKPPANLVPLCPQNQPGHPVTSAPAWSVPALLGERTPADYLWDAGAWYRVDAHPGVNAYNNKLAMQFAERAILAQPGAYLKTVGKEVLETFFTTDRPTDYLAMQFTVTPHVNPEVAYMAYWENRYAYTKENTHLHQPWAYLMFLYQEPVWFPGAVFFAVMVGGLVMLIRRWRRGLGRLAFLAWGVAIVNLVLPIAAHELDYRYAISAVPFACLALGLTFVRKPVASGASGTSGTSAAAVVASGTGASVEVTPGVEADAAD